MGEILLFSLPAFFNTRLIMLFLHSTINAVVLVLLLVFAFDYQTVRNQEISDARFNLASFLFDAPDRTSASLQRQIETNDEFLRVLDDIVLSYYALPISSSGLYMHYLTTSTSGNAAPDDDDDDAALEVQPPELFLAYRDGYYGEERYNTVIRRTFALREEQPLGPFANASDLIDHPEPCTPQEDQDHTFFIPCRASAIGELFDRMAELRVNFTLFSLHRQSNGDAVPRVWTVVVTFALHGHNSVMTMTASLHSMALKIPEALPIVLTGTLLLLFTVDAVLRLGAAGDILVPWCFFTNRAACFGESARHRRTPRVVATVESDGPSDIAAPTEGPVGSSSPVAQTSSRVSTSPSGTAAAASPAAQATVHEGEGWRALGFLSDGVGVAFAGLALWYQFQRTTITAVAQAVTILLAFAILFSCFRVVAVLKLFPSRYVVIDALLTAMGQLSMYAVGVFPVLLGYAVCGTVVFGGYGGYFAHITSSLVTLICATFGDNLISTFVEMDQSEFWLQALFARVFFMTFILVFVCNVLNIAHNIIQDSYVHAVKTHETKVRRGLSGADVTTRPASAASETQQRRSTLSRAELQKMLNEFRRVRATDASSQAETPPQRTA